MTKTFESLSNVQESYETAKRGKEFRASFSGFLAKDAEVRVAGSAFVVSSFTNISGSVDAINEQLGTDFVEDPEYNNVPANVSWFVNTQEEADLLQEKLVKGSRIVAAVVVGTHEYQDNLYLDLRIDTPYIEAPKASDDKAPKRKGKADLKVDDSDLPI